MQNPVRSIVVLYRDAFGGLPALTWLLCAAAFINRAGSMVVPFLGLYLKDRFGFTATEAGFVIGLYGVGAFFGSWIGGRLTDLMGAVHLQIAALASSAVWMLLMTQITNAWLLTGAVFVLGVCNDAFRPGSNTAAATSCPPALRRKALSLNRLALNLGWSFGPTIGGYLVQLDFRLMFVVDGATCGLAALWLWKALRGWNPKPPPRATTTATGETLDPHHGKPMRDRHFLWLMAANLVVLIAFMQYFTTGSRVFEEMGFSKSQVGWFLALNPIMITLFEMPIVHSLRGRSALPIVAWGSLVVGLGYLCLLLPFGWIAIALAMIVVAGGELLQMPMLGAYVNDHAPDHARGAYNGAYAMSFCLALVMAPVLGGALYDHAGATVLWTACAGGGVLGALGFLLGRRGAPAGPGTH
jgi:predicted MFS family arabinose efflux permease